MNSTRLRRPFVLAAAIVLGAGPAALSATTHPTTLRIATASPLDSVDPALANTPASRSLVEATCELLYTAATADGSVTPEVAIGMPTIGPSSNRPKQWKTYTIKLRHTYRFQDGTPVTAFNFADAIDRDANPDLASLALADMQEFVGLGAVTNGDARTLAGVVAVNNTTLRISTVKPVPDLASRLSHTWFCPVMENTPIAPGGVDHPPSDGPYYVQANTPGRVVLALNPYYAGSRKPVFSFIAFTNGVSLADCRTQVAAHARDLCLDALPTDQTTSPFDTLVADSSLARGVGCLTWTAGAGVDLATACRH